MHYNKQRIELKDVWSLYSKSNEREKRRIEKQKRKTPPIIIASIIYAFTKNKINNVAKPAQSSFIHSTNRSNRAKKEENFSFQINN